MARTGLKGVCVEYQWTAEFRAYSEFYWSWKTFLRRLSKNKEKKKKCNLRSFTLTLIFISPKWNEKIFPDFELEDLYLKSIKHVIESQRNDFHQTENQLEIMK